MLPTYTLPAAATAIESCLSANASAQVDRFDLFRLAAHDDRLRGWLKMARNPPNTECLFGRNYMGPALDSVLRDCEGIRRQKAGVPASPSGCRRFAVEPVPVSSIADIPNAGASR